ncbi:MAG: EAL domain-containing protein [Ruminococcus sp.]|nr:EAL domain-containing protein [Ruminococcus sp.]
MILVYACVVFLAAAFIAGCYIYTIRISTGSAIEKPIRRLFLFSVINVAGYGVAMFTKTELSALIAYGLFTTTADIMLIFLLIFARRYTGITSGLELEKKVFFFAILADAVLNIVNVFTKIYFRCAPVYDTFGHLFYRISSFGLLYYIHLVIIYSMALASFSVLLRKMISTPRIYKVKYAGILLITVVVMICHIIYMRFNLLFDYSIIHYSIIAFLICFFSLVYIPRGLMERLLFFTIANMKDGIICIDIEGRCVYANKTARQFCDAGIGMKAIEEQVERWLRENIGESNDIDQWDTVIRSDGKPQYYNIVFQKIYDNHMKYLGSFFLIHDRTEDVNRLLAEKYRATHDSLTGIYNREYFYEASREAIDSDPDRIYYIVTTDVKNFKIINDVFGIETGDKLLKTLAGITRSYSSSECVYGRLSGDKFALCLPTEKFNEEKLLSDFSSVSGFLKSETFKVHIHIGIYEVTDRSLRISVMCDRANLAIRSIKDSYENVAAYYDDHMRDKFMNEQKVISEFDDALADGQFHMYIQPQIFANGRIKGGEALVRWIHPKKGLIRPDGFIPILEHTGLIAKLDMYMWEQACIQLQKWQEEGYYEAYLSVNISQNDFYLLDVYEVITSLCKKYCLNPRCLHLEMTETAIMNNPKSQLKLMERLRQLGFIIEIDDFGSGYSSLNTLKDMTADVLKIDMGFLSKTANMEKSKMILQVIITLAKNLKMEVITEGVEDREQVDFLTEYGCDIFQGYYFAKPMKVTDFEGSYLDTQFDM